MSSVPQFPRRRSSGFQHVVAAFLAQPGLPFASVLPAERVEAIFVKHGNLFAVARMYSLSVVLWAFIGQVLSDGKQAACESAVACIIAFRQQLGLESPTADTGDYCRARNKLSEAAVREVAVEVAAEMEQEADGRWLWKKHHCKLVDGFTFTLPDTEKNQRVYPSPKSQKKGVGLPIARAVVMLSLATACAMDLAMGPYAGKETGETALLRQLLKSFAAGDVAVMDRFYCSFMMIALLLQQNVQTCARMHQRRHVDFRRGRRLGKYDHLIIWTKPSRPEWMDPETYDAIPDQLEMREIRYNVVQPGFRSETITIATTLTDAKEYSKEDIAELYGFRWNSELDIRSIKESLNLAHVRCKSPEMVRKEVWATLLGYNLIRTTAAAAALLHDKQPRQISFTSTCQFVLAFWMPLSCGLIASQALEAHCRTMLERISECEVANRPGRLEPRVLKRRRHGYKLMQQPRDVLRAELLNGRNGS